MGDKSDRGKGKSMVKRITGKSLKQALDILRRDENFEKYQVVLVMYYFN